MQGARRFPREAGSGRRGATLQMGALGTSGQKLTTGFSPRGG
jgi:hypothetical protein